MKYTDEQIEKAFGAAGEKIQQLESGQMQARNQIRELICELKAFRKSLVNSNERDGSYGGLWPTEHHAKSFGALVMVTIGKKQYADRIDKDMGTVEPEAGGNLVPTALSDSIIDIMFTYGKFRSNAMRVPVAAGKAKLPKVSTDLTVYAPGEAGNITKSDMEIGLVGLDPTKLACLTAVNRELEEDALAALGEIVGRSIARSMAKQEDLCGFLGDGSSTYFGMTGIVGALRGIASAVGDIPGLVEATGNVYSEITLADFQSVAGRLPADYDEGAKWFMHKRFYYDVVWPLAKTAGVANIFEILSNQQGKGLLGYPVEFVPCMPYTEANSQICCLLGDLKMGAYLGERKTLEIERSDDVYFAMDQVGIRGIERIDVNAFGVGDATNPGPIVGLITKSS